MKRTIATLRGATIAALLLTIIFGGSLWQSDTPLLGGLWIVLACGVLVWLVPRRP